jgi:putative (di)nucleoside polyphosphate hydrolase
MSESAERPYRPNVGALLRDSEGRFLLGERIDRPGSWQFPQGGVDPGESPEEALWRELGEELGLEEPRSVCRVLGVGPTMCYDFPPSMKTEIARRYRGQEQTLFLLEFFGSKEGIQLDRDSLPEFRAVTWVPVEEMLERIWGPKRPNLVQTLEALAHLLD